MPDDGSDFFRTSEIAQVNQMELRSGKKLPPIPNYGNGQIIVQEFSQSKNRSSPNPESPVQDHGLSQNQNPGGIRTRSEFGDISLSKVRSFAQH